MERFIFKEHALEYSRGVKKRIEITETIESILTSFADVLPASKTGRILIKPNLHMDLNSLMGNTTDLRILSDLIRLLQKRGYKNLIVGEGTNCGMHRFNIDVYSRLGVTDLVSYYGVEFVDFNKSNGIEIELSGNTKARVADICLENDCFIDVPKIKTHRLVALSVCLKSLVGCFVRMDKRKIHLHIDQQIVKMNEIIKPDLYIVDGLIAKQGQGPAWGEPVRLDTLIAGTDPFLLDAFCAWFTGFEYNEINYLKLAMERNIIDQELLDAIRNSVEQIPLKKAIPQRFVNFLAMPLLDPIRNLIRPLSDNKWITKFLYHTKIREDLYDDEDPQIQEIVIDKSKCNLCKSCNDICPMNIDITDSRFSVESTGCIKCLYCYMICPEKCISLQGNLGYLVRAMADYQPHIDKLGYNGVGPR